MRERQVGVDLGGTTFSVAIVDSEGRIEAIEDHDTLADQGPERVMERIALAIETLIAKTQVKRDELRGIGLGMPGLHDTERGVCIYAANLKWNNVPVREPFEKRFGMPVVLENDVRVAALGERHFGSGGDVDNMMLVTLGTGVGGAIIMGGRLQRGGAGYAGEVGHQTINPDGPICGCGNPGCLEAYAGVRGILGRARAAYGRRPSDIITKMAGENLEDLSPRMLHEAALLGDEIAHQVLTDTGRYVGIGLSNVVSLLNPSRIVIGGGIARAGDIILDPIRDEIKQRVPVVMADTVEVVPAKLGHKAGVIGASTLLWSPIA